MSGERVGLTIWRSRVRVQLWRFAGFVLGSSRVQILGKVFLKIANWLPLASWGFLVSVWIIFSYYLACSRSSDGRAQRYDGGSERVKSYAGKNEGRLGRVLFFSPALYYPTPLEQAKIT